MTQNLSCPNWEQIYDSNPKLQIIGRCIDTYNSLIVKDDRFKLELDSQEGQSYFKLHVSAIEQLITTLQVIIPQRHFRSQYTKAYRILYNQGDLGYLPQIFDSAQEGFPYIWVNGQHFDFSSEVLQLGEKLIESYYGLIQCLRFLCLKIHRNTLTQVLRLTTTEQLSNESLTASGIYEKLLEFDKNWIAYEKKYINQLIRIQIQAKTKITQAVMLQETLSKFENQEKLKGKIFLNGAQYDALRRNLCKVINKINAVANVQGKGRDDLSYDILLAAESVVKKVAESQSKAIRNVADRIRQSYQKIRQILRSFGQNLQLVDPQLKNNPQLTEALYEYESCWQKGKRYFLQVQKQKQLLAFSLTLEATQQKYSSFRDMLEYSDPSIFWIIPSLILLRSFENEDEGLADSFLGYLCKQKYEKYRNTKQLYGKLKQQQTGRVRSNQLFNDIEQQLVKGIPCQNPQIVTVSIGKKHTSDNYKQQFGKIMSNIKQLSVTLQRVNPSDWNDMLAVVMMQNNQ